MQGVRHTRRGECAPIGLPEAVYVVRPNAVRFVVAHGAELLRSGRGRAGRCGVPAYGIEVAQIMSWVRPAYQGVKIRYIYNVLGYYQTKITLN